MSTNKAENKHYDVVIVGAGISGAILADQLTQAGKTVLILEAGKTKDLSYNSYLDYLNTFYQALAKVPESPYPFNPNAPQPDVLFIDKPDPHNPDAKTHSLDKPYGYFVQMGPMPYGSTYTRVPGGTTMHWLGTCLRMLPEDFQMRTLFGQGRDWPIAYEEMQKFYEMAEFEIGVSADVEEQKALEKYLRIPFGDDYVYPMKKIPQSYLDTQLSERLKGMTVKYSDPDRQQEYEYEVLVTSTPQGRNSDPNPDYKYLGKPHNYQPVGAVGNPSMGQRCEGNTSCVPICPVQAKYNATKTLHKAMQRQRNDHPLLELRTQAVASRVLYEERNGRLEVTGIEFKAYQDPHSSEHAVHVATGRLYVLATHAVENAKLLLASKLEGQSGQVGKNLMDHPVLNTWAMMPENVGTLRGPLSTSGIESLRGGGFRKERSAFRVEIGNDGWNWAENTPYSTVNDLVDNKNLFGKKLRERIRNDMPRQFRLGFLIEQIPEETNRVTIDERYKDQLGNYRPVIHYDFPDYSKKGMAAALQTAEQIYEFVGAENFTNYDAPSASAFVFQEKRYSVSGAGHFAGTHVMGTTPQNSVVDKYQRFWGSDNLYVVGCGSFPTMGTSNPTLTMAALTFHSAQRILEVLDGNKRSIEETESQINVKREP